MSDHQSSAAADLAAANNATLGAQMPGSSFQVVTTADGMKLPTGTIAALLVNIKAYDAALAANDQAKVAELEPRIKAAIPVLWKVGMFDLFRPEEWAREEGRSEGRKIVGRLAMAGVEK